MRDVIVVWVLVGCVALCISVWNYWNAAWDTRQLVKKRINGEVLHAATDERQAEMFRITGFASYTIAGILAGYGPVGSHVDTVVGLLIFGLALGAGSAVRSSINRQRAWTKARLKTWPEIERRDPPQDPDPRVPAP